MACRASSAPLVAFAVFTTVTAVFHLDVRTVADLGQLASALPAFGLPEVPLTLETLRILLPVSLTLAAVGLLESLLAAQIADDMTDTPSDKNRACMGQGVAVIASAVVGGMGGGAMIGQSVINVSSGGRGRLSTLTAGVFLLVLLVVLQDLLAIVPVAARTAVMIMVSVNPFSWASRARLRTIHERRRSAAASDASSAPSAPPWPPTRPPAHRSTPARRTRRWAGSCGTRYGSPSVPRRAGGRLSG